MRKLKLFCALTAGILLAIPGCLAINPEVELNNIAVKEISDKHFSEAIKNLEASLKLNPEYKNARENLGIAYNNLGLELYSGNPRSALDALIKSYYFSKVRSTLQNIEQVVPIVYEKKATSHLYLKLADDALISNDLIAAYTYLDLAGNLDKNAIDPERMQALDDRIKRQFKDGLFVSHDAAKITDATLASEDYSAELKDYVVTIQKKIKSAWAPRHHSPPFDVPRKTVLLFQINPQGAMSNPRVTTSSGSAEVDRVALDALDKAAPFPALPASQKEPVDVQFTFFYNLSGQEAKTQADKPASSAAKGSSAPELGVTFNNQAYLHRYSEDDQHEFTPLKQPDLNTWEDMVTLSVFKNITNKEILKKAFDNLKMLYSETGVLLDSYSQTKDKFYSPEYFVVGRVQDSTGKFTEIVFTRLLLKRGTGHAIVYSHRFYADSGSASDVDKWTNSNKSAVGAELSHWDKWPTSEVLDKLSQGLK